MKFKPNIGALLDAGFKLRTKNETEAIKFLRDCQKTHIEWAEYFEHNPEVERAMVKTGEWDNAQTHRKLEKQYEQVIQIILEAQRYMDEIEVGLQSRKEKK